MKFFARIRNNYREWCENSLTILKRTIKQAVAPKKVFPSTTLEELLKKWCVNSLTILKRTVKQAVTPKKVFPSTTLEGLLKKRLPWMMWELA